MAVQPPPAAQKVAATKTMRVKAIKAAKLVWALQQGSFANGRKWLSALKKKLRKQRKRTVGRGGMQPISDPRTVTDPSKLLSVVFYQVK